MKVLCDRIVVGLLVLFFLLASSVNAVETTELARDNGEVSDFMNLPSGTGYGVSFSTPSASWPIRRVRIFGFLFGKVVEGPGQDVTIEIWMMNGTELHSSVHSYKKFTTAPDWIDFNLRGPIVSGNFRVVVYAPGQPNVGGIKIGYSLNPPSYSDTIVVRRILTDWKEIGFSQSTLNNRSRINWMIRVCSTPVAEITSAPGYRDPAGDLFDDKGNPLKAEPYLDIISVDLRRPPDGIGYLVEINVNGPLPSKIDSPLYFDWGIYFDLDSNPNTGTKGSLLYNDVGFDYGVKLFKSETGSDYSTVAYKVGTAGGTTVTIRPYCDIVGDRILFVFNFPGDIKVPSKLIWMVVTRKFPGNPISAPLLAADKIPNLGHYETAIESLEIARSTLTRTSGVAVSNTTSSRSETSFFGFLNVQSLQQIGGAAATGGSVLFGWYLKTRKRRFASKYLRTIDSTYREYLKNPEECKKRLNQMREEVLKMLENGKIEEAQFSILDARLEKHLKDTALIVR